MAMGLDMLLNTLVKAVGLKPEVFIPQMENLFKWNMAKIQEFDARIANVEISQAGILQMQKAILEQNAQILALLNGGGNSAVTETLIIENEGN